MWLRLGIELSYLVGRLFKILVWICNWEVDFILEYLVVVLNYLLNWLVRVEIFNVDVGYLILKNLGCLVGGFF